jgi:predicted small lipoprotein YifL
MNMKKKYLCVFVFIVLLNGCGTKGELYIPEEKYPQSFIDKDQDKIIIKNYQLA